MRELDNGENNLIGDVSYIDGVGNVVTPISVGGGGGGVPIIPNNTTYNNTANSDGSLILRVSSNQKGANVILNDINTFKNTPDTITLKLSDVLAAVGGQATIKVQKTGYTTSTYFKIHVQKNPQYSGIGTNPNVQDLSKYGQQIPVIQYTDTTPYIFQIYKYVNNTLDTTTAVSGQGITDLVFDDMVAIIPIDDTGNINNIVNTLTISIDNPNALSLIQNSKSNLLVQSTTNTFTSNKTNDTFTFVSNDLTKYRITSITVNSTTKTFEPLNAQPLESLTTTLTLDGDYTVSVTTQAINVTLKDVPSITLINPNTERTYNINTNAGVPIGFTKSGNPTYVTAYVNNKSYKFTDLGTDPTNAGIIIPASAFSTIGNYRIVLVPSNGNGDGDSVQITYGVVDDVYVGIPDITSLSFPKELVGPDYVGTDVSFDVTWKTINADYVRIWTGEGYIQLPANGTKKLNVQDILNLLAGKYSENADTISFQLKVIPYNISGKELVTGKTETASITFYKGKLTIPRATALNRILEGFTTQFGDIATNTPDDTSKYLTHLLHLGDGNNKVITTWTGSQGTIIAKLYEPLDTTVQPNQQIWISKLQSNPTIETVTLTGETNPYCPHLKGPNFTIEADNGIGYQVYDSLLASGSNSSTNLLYKYTDSLGIDISKLQIQYVSGSQYTFENFSNFGSVEERANNFYYKLQLIENYKSRYSSLVTNTMGSVTSNNAISAFDNINKIVNGFDGFENFLYTSTNDLAYPKQNDGTLYPTSNPISIAWYEALVSEANNYDRFNPNLLSNNIPEFISEDYDNENFVTFLNMIGQHFDNIWCYINAFTQNKIAENKKVNGIIDDMIYHMLESMGWQGKKAFDSHFLWEYAFGQNQDGTQKYGMSLKDANNEVWRRMLNNLPYLLKHKGTGRAMKAIMACYGVPQSLLTIMEFGGPQDPTVGGVSQFTFDDRTSALYLKNNASVNIPWHTASINYPQSIEINFKPDNVNNFTLLSGSQFSLNFTQTTGSFATLNFGFAADGTTSPYFTPPLDYIDVIYSYGPDIVSSSYDFPLSTEYFSNVVVNQHDLGNSLSKYEVFLGTSNGHRIITSVSMSLTYSSSKFETGSALLLGGEEFSGQVDEFRLWIVPLEKSKFDNHTLHPNSINGNSYTASSTDLIFRLDFEYPKDRTRDNQIKNVSISEAYGENYATAQYFYSSSTYPYQYIPYDRTVTANISSMGHSFSNKIRFEDQFLVDDLSYKKRATVKSFDRAPIDSNRLGIFLSPTKELNMDIIKSFGDFNIDDYIGDPEDDYNYDYAGLKELRTYYFERLNRNINEYIQLVRYIDKSLFDVLHDVAPARAKVSKGLLIEPHLLERSKTRWNKPTAENDGREADINVTDTTEIFSENIGAEADFDGTTVVTFTSEVPDYDAKIENSGSAVLVAGIAYYDGKIDYSASALLEATAPFYEASITAPSGSSIQAEVDSIQHTVVGMDPNSLANAGYGLYAVKGNSILTSIDIFGNTTQSRVSAFVVNEQYTKKIKTQTAGYPLTGSASASLVKYEYITNTFTKNKITELPFSGSVSVGGTTLSVTAIDGYLPTHYKFTNNNSLGLQRSFYKGSTQTSGSTPDGLAAVQTFTTNPNILKVANTGRGSGEPILEVD
jgi:hypothetical protein